MNLLYWKDLAERTAGGFGVGFLGTLLTDWTGVIPSDWKAWLGVGVAAGIASPAKGLLGKLIGDKGSASWLPSLSIFKRTP